MPDPLSLVCPIRGPLKISAKSADGLTPTEEKFRIDAIRYLISRGYPEAHFRVEAVVKRFGVKGRNSFRADIAVLDVPVADVPPHDVDQLLEHTVLLGEVKRDNRGYEQAKQTQVKPMLDFAARLDCVALYWDNVEQRVFWREVVAGLTKFREGPLGSLPEYGQKVFAKPLTFETISPTDSLVSVFDRVQDVLHAASVPQSKRYSVMLQFLLAKLFDEHSHENKPDSPLDVQDVGALGISPGTALSRFNQLLGQAANYYGKYLPSAIEDTVDLSGEVLRDVLRILAPVKIIASKHSVIQEFYMKFAKSLYKWELGQYFTPTTVTAFIVEVLNPQFGEHIKDPACGSADFLTAAFRIGRQFDTNYADAVWGADNSPEAVQVAVLNMLLNGDGKTNIAKEDSLVSVNKYEGKYDAVVCNPPFGQQIVERRQDVLKLYSLGHQWSEEGGTFQEQPKLLEKQETGLLFTEACVRQVKPGGRVAIILPNGYLGNRGPKYLAFREWLLRACHVVSICAFPRFTFKGSGADVSASVVYLVRRGAPLELASKSEHYQVHIEVIEKVGWSVGDKRAKPLYKRDPVDGSYLINETGERLLDADFERVKADIRNSEAGVFFPWLVANGASPSGSGWSIPIGWVLDEPTLSLDPKRYCRKVVELRDSIEAGPCFRLGDVVDFLPERIDSSGNTVDPTPSNIYRYAQLEDIRFGDYGWLALRGWELPDRAKHFAEPGDIYVGAIWGSVRKWFYTPSKCGNLVVTNGCHRLRIKPGKEKFLPDLLAGLCSEAYAVQMRSLARGSDGLAETWPEDAASVLIPRIVNSAVRTELRSFVERLKAGRTRFDVQVRSMIADGRLPCPNPPNRPAHSVLV